MPQHPRLFYLKKSTKNPICLVHCNIFFFQIIFGSLSCYPCTFTTVIYFLFFTSRQHFLKRQNKKRKNEKRSRSTLGQSNQCEGEARFSLHGFFWWPTTHTHCQFPFGCHFFWTALNWLDASRCT